MKLDEMEGARRVRNAEHLVGGTVDLSFQAPSGCRKFTVRRHKFNGDSSLGAGVEERREKGLGVRLRDVVRVDQHLEYHERTRCARSAEHLKKGSCTRHWCSGFLVQSWRE